MLARALAQGVAIWRVVIGAQATELACLINAGLRCVEAGPAVLRQLALVFPQAGQSTSLTRLYASAVLGEVGSAGALGRRHGGRRVIGGL